MRGTTGRSDVCETGKVAFSSRDLAKRALRTIRNKGMRAYQCPRCHLWHLTSMRSER